MLSDCLGIRCDSLEIAEVRKLELQPVGKGKKNCKRSGKARSGSTKKKFPLEYGINGRRKNRMRLVEDDSE